MTPEEQLAAHQATMLSTAVEAQGVNAVAAGQLTRLWASDFAITTDQAGRFELRTKTGETPADAIKARLASPEYSHFAPPPAAPAHPSGLTDDQVKAAQVRALTAGFGSSPNAGGSMPGQQADHIGFNIGGTRPQR